MPSWTTFYQTIIGLTVITESPNQALLVASFAQIKDIQIWYNLESQLMNQLKWNHCDGWTSIVLSTFADTIQQNYPHQLTTFHQKSLSIEYCRILMHRNASTQSLIQILRMMMDQNRKLGIRLDYAVWNSFFLQFGILIDLESHAPLPIRNDFNALLGDLEEYFVPSPGASRDFVITRQGLLHNLFSCIRQHGTYSNLETYRILERLHRRFGLCLGYLVQTNPHHDRIYPIVSRLRVIRDVLEQYDEEKVPQSVMDFAVRTQPDVTRRYYDNQWWRALKSWKVGVKNEWNEWLKST